MSIWGYGRERNGILGNLLNTHPMALKYLMPALMHFYIGKLQCCLTWSEALPGQRWNKLAQVLSSMTNSVRDLSILRSAQLTGRITFPRCEVSTDVAPSSSLTNCDVDGTSLTS